jgi:hypothetical protein
MLISNFQFPEETENTQSPAANKNGNPNILIGQNQLSRIVINTF